MGLKFYLVCCAKSDNVEVSVGGRKSSDLEICGGVSYTDV